MGYSWSFPIFLSFLNSIAGKLFVDVDDGIQIGDFWFRKGSLNQLSHHHCQLGQTYSSLSERIGFRMTRSLLTPEEEQQKNLLQSIRVGLTYLVGSLAAIISIQRSKAFEHRKQISGRKKNSSQFIPTRKRIFLFKVSDLVWSWNTFFQTPQFLPPKVWRIQRLPRIWSHA